MRSFTSPRKNRRSPRRSPAKNAAPSQTIQVDTSVTKDDSSSPRTPSPSPRTPSPRTLKFQREDRKLCRVLDGLFYDLPPETELENASLLQETASDFTEQVVKNNFNDIYEKISESLDVLSDSKSSDESTKRNLEFLARSVLELSSRAAFRDVRDEIDELSEEFGARLIAQNQYIRYLKRRTLCHAIDRVFGSRGQSNLMKRLAFRSWVGFVVADRKIKCKEASVILMDEILNHKRLSRVECFFRVWVDATSRLDVSKESLSDEIELSKAHVYSTKSAMRVKYAFI